MTTDPFYAPDTAAPPTPLKTTPPAPGYVKKRDVADHLRVTPRTVNEWMARGLPHYRIGGAVRFSLAEVEGWMAEKCRVVRRK